MTELAAVSRGKALVVTDGAAGNENQALALAYALGLSPEIIRIDLPAPWRWFSPRVSAGVMSVLPEHLQKAFQAPWPSLVIGCGRQSALITRMFHHRSAGETVAIQILDPRISTAHFDWVVTPAHDDVNGPNVIATQGGLNRVDEAWLVQSRQAFPVLEKHPAPRCALLIGGPTRALSVDIAYMERLATTLIPRIKSAGGCLWITSSRRTPQALKQFVRRRFTGVSGFQWHDENDGPNPYAGMLAWADVIVVTPDSVNMLSEAAATNAVVQVFESASVQGKIGRFVKSLLANGRISELVKNPLGITASMEARVPLRETQRVAAQIRTAIRGKRAG